MNNERVVSMKAPSMIYHKPGCKYVKRMKHKNAMSLTRNNAIEYGYHSCKCCHSMAYTYKAEISAISDYKKNKRMEFKYSDGVLYVKTEISCWKIVYSRKFEDLVLYHRNDSVNPIDFSHPENEEYHRQKDRPHCHNISGYLDYINEHDKYKAAIGRGEKITRFTNEKYRRSVKKSEHRRACRRVDNIFRILESQNSDYRALSFC